MTAGRYGAGFVSVVVGSLIAAAGMTTLLLYGLKWTDDNSALGDGSGSVTFILLARALLIPIMLCLSIRMGCRAVRILMRRVEVFPPTANSAITYYGVTAAYVSLGIIIPIAGVFTPAILEPPLYALAALLLLAATVGAISEKGQLRGPPIVSPRVAAMLVVAAGLVVVGVSAAYARFVLVGDAMSCTAWDCPPERTVGVMGLMMVAALLPATAIVRDLRSPMGMTRQGINSAVAFACLALLFPVAILPALVMPYDASVPSFFYGMAAVVFLIVAVGRRDDEEPVGSSGGLTAG